MQRTRVEPLLQRVRRTVARHQMLVPRDRVLIALSGGPDSTALLAALAALADEYKIELRAAHLNHQLRGAESLRDQGCAAAAAERFGVPCTVESVQVSGSAAGLEARARERRYAFLLRVAVVEGCTKIATGHTLDDQAETVLMRLLRGAGPDGLVGIPPVRPLAPTVHHLERKRDDDRIIRPLIECPRQEVLAFLEASGLTYCEDSSNRDRRFLRNRVRHDVMPLLQSISPAVVRCLARTADQMREEAALLEEQAGAILAGARSADGALALSVVAMAPAGLRPRLLRAWLRGLRGDLRGLTARHLEAVLDLVQGARPNSRVDLPRGEQVVREYAWLRFATGRPAPAAAPQLLVDGAAVCLESGWQISVERAPANGRSCWGSVDLLEMVADAEAITGPLLVRTAVPGDRVQPVGLHGHRKLQDIFVDRKLPVRLRHSCPVVEAGGEILWVPGVVRSASAAITGKTRSVLRLVARQTDIAGA